MRTTVDVSYIGEQREMFNSGEAKAAIRLAELSGLTNLYALGPVAGLDGEITIFDSEAYVSKVRGPEHGYLVDRTFDHGATFLAWAQMREWDDVPVAGWVSNYRELEIFVKEAAQQQGIDTNAPFAFLLAGTPREVVWHINVDRTEGQPINRERFKQSKQRYVLHRQRVDIFGVHSERHGGIFMGEDMKIHIHFVSRDTPATGHIDEIAAGSMILRLPRA
jgi:hypothetical protein